MLGNYGVTIFTSMHSHLLFELQFEKLANDFLLGHGLKGVYTGNVQPTCSSTGMQGEAQLNSCD